MAKEALTGDELLAQLGELGGVEGTSTKSGTKTSEADADLFKLPERAAKPSSRPHTPRIGSTSTTSASKSSPKRSGAGTPPSNDGARSSEEKAHMRKSGESSRSFHNSFTPASTEADSPPEKSSDPVPEPDVQATSSGGWWGALSATAGAAFKQAESLAKEIRQNEEAQRWAEQVKGNVGALRGLGGELRSRALPTFTNILHTLAPPISSHERLQIHITHDLVGYPSLDPLIYATFSRVMAQVEGGDLMVIQRGQESRQGSEGGFTGSSSSGWNDGPWWRQATSARSLGAVKGLIEGSKLSKAGAESYATEYFAARGGLEEAAKQATEVLNESNPVRSSDIFLAIQAISQAEDDLQTPGGSTETEDGAAIEPPSEPDNLISFALYLSDPVHGITFSTTTQSLPEKWTHWLDASASRDSPDGTNLPEEIAEIVVGGGVDPREWVAEWVEEILTLGVGIVAQRYVARRMGVGSGGLGRAKARQEALESNGGEAARVI